MTWYDKLALAGLVIAFIGGMMFVVGLGFMIDARNKARSSYRASIKAAHEEIFIRRPAAP